MELNLKEGKKYTSELKVQEKDSAKEVGSGDLSVYSSPMMIALIENAALNCVSDDLPDGYSTVGINVNVNHIAATPIGMNVKATATLTEIKGKKLIFSVEAYDEKGKIGEGTHVRYIINTKKFLEKVNNI